MAKQRGDSEIQLHYKTLHRKLHILQYEPH
jgi:hypothetical protein